MSAVTTQRSLLDGADSREAAARWLAVPTAAAVGVVLGVVLAILVAWWAGLVAAVLAGAAAWAWSESRASGAPDRQLGGRPLDPDEHPRLANLVDGLAIAVGEPVPEVRVLDEAAANLAVSGPSGGAVMVVTTGLLGALDRVELEGVVAEGLARIRANDALLGARAASLVAGSLVAEGPGCGTGASWRRAGAAARARRLRDLLGEHRDFLADLAAVDMTRYPPALASAFDAMRRVGTAVPGATWGTAHLWIAPPLGSSDGADGRLNELFGPVDPFDHRIDLLGEL